MRLGAHDGERISLSLGLKGSGKMGNAEDAPIFHRCAGVRRKLAGAFEPWLCAFSLKKSTGSVDWR